MSVQVGIDVSGFLADVRRLENAVDGGALSAAAMAGGFVVEGAGKEGIIRYDFIDTGATLNSVAATAVGEGEVQIGPATEYAIFGELGIGQSEKPFMRQALEQNQRQIAEAVAAELREALRRAIR